MQPFMYNENFKLSYMTNNYIKAVLKKVKFVFLINKYLKEGK